MREPGSSDRMSSPQPELRPLLDLHPDADDLLGDVLAGLTATPKTLPCKYLYDTEGSLLFDRICELEEYYPTRTEIAIMQRHHAAMAEALGPFCLVVEFGTGSGTKTQLLLESLKDPIGFVPIDISREHLQAACRELASLLPDLEILPVCADFTQEITLPRPRRSVRRTVVFFPGSTVGNFTHRETLDFLRRVTRLCGTGGGLLIGVDTKKDKAVLERAYDDAQGVTAAFNLNLLRRINRELGGDFDLTRFRHRAIYDEEEGRIEMHLVSLAEQRVRLGDHVVDFAEGESIHTESSHKYRVEEFAQIADAAGLSLEAAWTDSGRLFTVQYYRVR